MKKRISKPEPDTPQATPPPTVRLLREIYRLSGEALHAVDDGDFAAVRAKLETIRRRARVNTIHRDQNENEQ